MSDLTISTSAIGAGVALGALAGYSAKSVTVGAVGAAFGLAAGGLAAYAADRGERLTPGDGTARGLLHPLNALGVLGGAGLGMAVAGAITSTAAFADGPLMSLGQKGAMYGAFAIGGAALGAAALGFLRTDG